MNGQGWPEFKTEDFNFTEWCMPFNECFCDILTLGRSLRGVHQELASNGDPSAEVMHFITCCYVSFDLDPDDADKPIVYTHERAAVKSDTELGKRLECVIPHLSRVENPELRSRLADLSWLVIPRRRSHNCARIALHAYLEAAETQANNQDRLTAIHRVRRAAQLLRQVAGRKWESDSDLPRIRGQAHSLFNSAPLEEPGVFVKAGEVLCEFGCPSGIDFVEIVSNKVKDCRQAKKFHGAISLQEVLIRWHNQNNDIAASASARVDIADIFVEEAFTRHNPLVQRALLERAIVALRAAGGQNSRIHELHRYIVEMGFAIEEHTQQVAFELPVPEGLEQAVSERIRVLQACATLFDALHYLAQFVMLDIPKKATLEQRIRDSDLTFQDLLPILRVSLDGRVTHRQPNKLVDPASFTSCKVATETRLHLHGISILVLIRLRRTIAEKFNPTVTEIAEILRYSPFLPLGREQIVAIGLELGFRDKDFEGAHFLLPQLENGLRQILTDKGHIPSKLDKDLLQDAYLLNHLLEKDEALVDILGEDMVSALRAILVHRCGSNFRNELLHGLCDERDGTSTDGRCVWALMLALIMGSIGPSPAKGASASENITREPGGEVM